MDRLTQRGAASVWRHPEYPPPSLRQGQRADERGEGGNSVAAAGSGAGRAGAGEFAAEGGDGAGGYGLAAGPGAFNIGIDGLVDDDRGLCQPEPRGFRADGLGPAVNRAKHRLRRSRREVRRGRAQRARSLERRMAAGAELKRPRPGRAKRAVGLCRAPAARQSGGDIRD